MSAQTGSPERRIYLAACKLQDPNLRSEYLDEACGSDGTLRQRLRLMLETDAGDVDPLNLVVEQLGLSDRSSADTASEELPIPNDARGADQVAGTIDVPVDVSQHPVIGRYKLLEEVGRGGMGAVYMAQQTSPVKRKVALKIIKPGMDSREVITRFQAERQALALMDHPNIARVLDAGTTDEGRPYFVMELVRGIPITQFCRDKRLGLDDRLKLFVEVCQAVQHAHQKAIIHRDLKPGNILVTLRDGAPVVKVIDFGVAKALNQELTEQTLFTQFSQMIGTPLYMSPEQAEMSELDVDTRSDIYSLGVVLYEILTGTTPIARESFAKLGFDAVRNLIVEHEPERPSSRLSTLKAELDSTAAKQKQVRPKILAGQLGGELDWIVMKALEKDRTRRYQTANGLAADVQRYIHGETVEACPPSLAYRLRKILRRYRTAVLTSATVFLGILIGAGFAVWKAIEADAERQVASQQRDLADQSFEKSLAAVDQMLQRVAAKSLINTPETIQVRLRLYGDAVGFYQGLLELRPDDQRVLERLASTYELAGRLDLATLEYDRGLGRLNSAHAIRSELCDRQPNDARLVGHLAECIRLKATTLSEMRRTDEASDLCETAVALMEGHPDREQWAFCMGELALVRDRQRRHAEAEKILLDAFPQLIDGQVELTERNWERHVAACGFLSNARNGLAEYQGAAEARSRAIELARQAVERRWDLPVSLHLLSMHLTLRGKLYASDNQYQLALNDLTEAWAILTEYFKKFPASREFYFFGECGRQLVTTYKALGRMDEAHSLAALRPVNGAEAYAVAHILDELGDSDGHRENLELALQYVGDHHRVRRDLGIHYYGLQNWSKAVTYLSQQTGRVTANDWGRLAHAQFKLGQFQPSLESLRRVWTSGTGFGYIPVSALAACEDRQFRQGYLQLLDQRLNEENNTPALIILRDVVRMAFGESSERSTMLRHLSEIEGKLHDIVRTQPFSRDDKRLMNSTYVVSYAGQICIALNERKDAQVLLATAARWLGMARDADYLTWKWNLPNLQYQAALLALAIDDRQAYLDQCRSIEERFSSVEATDAIRWVLWACSLGPGALEDYEPIVMHAQAVMERDGEMLRPYYGAFLYRAGRFEEAQAVLEPILGTDVADASTTYFQYFYAMCQYQLGNSDVARTHLERANDEAAGELDDSPTWAREMTLELLRDEAELLILPPQIHSPEAVGSRIADES